MESDKTSKKKEDDTQAILSSIKDQKETFKVQALTVSEANNLLSIHTCFQKRIPPTESTMGLSQIAQHAWSQEHSNWEALFESCLENGDYSFCDMEGDSENISLFRTSCLLYSYYQDSLVHGSFAPMDLTSNTIDIQQSELIKCGHGQLFKWIYYDGEHEHELESPFVDDIPDWPCKNDCKLTLFLALTESVTDKGEPSLEHDDDGKIKFVKYMTIKYDSNLEKEPLCYNLCAERDFQQGTILPMYVIGSCLTRAETPFCEWGNELANFPGDSIYSVAVMDKDGYQRLHDPMLKIIIKKGPDDSTTQWKLCLGLGMHFAHCTPTDQVGSVIGMNCGHYLACRDIKVGEFVYYDDQGIEVSHVRKRRREEFEDKTESDGGEEYEEYDEESSVD